MVSIESIVHEQKESIRKRVQEIEFVPENPKLYDEAMQSPLMFVGERRARMNSTGEIYIKSFHDLVEAELSEGEELRVPKAGEKRTVQVRFSKFETIENAIKSTGHLKDEYGQQEGREVERLRGMWEYAHTLGLRFARNEIDLEELQKVKEDMATQLVTAKLDRAKKPSKRRIKDRFSRAVTRDSLNRLNPSRARWLLSHGEEDLNDELDFTELVDDKYTYLAHLLHVFRNDQRAKLSRIRDHANLIVGMSEENKEFDAAVDLLIRDSVNELSTFNKFTNPYALAAHQSRILINGNTHPLDRLTLEVFAKPGRERFRLSQQEVERYMRVLPISRMYSRRLIQEAARQVRSELSQALNNGARALGELEENERPRLY